MARRERTGREGIGIGTAIVVAGIVSAIVSVCVVGVATVIALAVLDAVPDGADGSSRPARSEAAAEPDAVDADPRRAIEAAFAADDFAPRLYRFRLPPDAVHVRADLDAGRHDVDLRIAFGEQTASDEDWHETSAGAEGDESASITRDDEPDFARKPLMVRIDRYEDCAEDCGEIPYTLQLTVVTHAPRARLAPGTSASGTISPDTGHRAVYDVVIPAGVNAVRIDIVDVRQDLDLAADTVPVLDPAHATTTAATPIGRESLVLRRGEMRLGAGEQVLSLVVFDAAQLSRTIPFGVRVTAGDAPPPEVRRLPRIPRGANAAERAAAGVVEINAGPNSEGSGVVVGRAGRILTAAHVVEGAPLFSDEIVIACTTDITREPEELLRGRVIRRDDERDIAIVEVTSTLYGDALPGDWELPRVPVRWEQPTVLGETVHACGFPVLHGSTERSEVSWTSGVLSGYERPFEHLLLRFDAEISSGSSGGALLDAQHRLIGITVAMHGDLAEFSATGLAVPLAEIPADWIDLLK